MMVGSGQLLGFTGAVELSTSVFLHRPPPSGLPLPMSMVGWLGSRSEHSKHRKTETVAFLSPLVVK